MLDETCAPWRRCMTMSMAGLFCGLIAAGLAGPAAAAPDRKPVASPEARKVDGPSNGAAPADGFQVQGFRSAKFGMGLEDVRKAIQRDFNPEPATLQQGVNRQERTKTLELRLDDLIPGAGPCAVGYVFGHSSERLMQVNVMWGGAVNPSASMEDLLGAANALHDYFVDQPFQEAGRLTKAVAADGQLVIVFRGIDAKGRMTLLTVSAPPDVNASPLPAGRQPPVMVLSYIETPGKPDIFRIEKGF